MNSCHPPFLFVVFCLTKPHPHPPLCLVLVKFCTIMWCGHVSESVAIRDNRLCCGFEFFRVRFCPSSRTVPARCSRHVVMIPRQICDKYPEWLATHRERLPPADYQRYGLQYQSFQRVLAVYEVGLDNSKHVTIGCCSSCMSLCRTTVHSCWQN